MASQTEVNDDLALVQACLEGDPRSFRQLYQRHQARVRSILFQLAGATHLDDLVQEVFLRAWRGLPKFQQSAQFSTWLYRIAWNVACDQRRRFAQQRQQVQVLGRIAPLQQEAPDLMKRHYQEVLQQGLAQLSWQHRSVLVLHDLEEQPQKAIADILKIPVGTVKSRLFHARAALRTYLQKAGIQP
ncbi:MAG: sigma-70 family RNA polymerase sigma factor [Cyanobacteriota bacterium]|nr:sigma-70 family RNA polymerase sigma factor [Cyanobacteriota bacterium]